MAAGDQSAAAAVSMQRAAIGTAQRAAASQVRRRFSATFGAWIACRA